MTTKQFLVRAYFEFGFLDGVPIAKVLPVRLGPFQLNQSPNAELFLTDRGFVEPTVTNLGQHDPNYPSSLLYLENKYVCANSENPMKHADDALDRLERLLRLFQPGEVSALRHGVWRIDKNGRLTPHISFYFKPVKPPIEGLHQYGNYPLNDASLGSLVNFIDRFWHILDKIPKNLQTAMARFSSSYEKRDIADRLVDLVIAMETLFGDGDSGSIAYKVAMRGASWLHSTGSERRAAFDTIKKLYGYRNKVVHGSLNQYPTSQEVNELEGVVRLALRKFLEWRVHRKNTPFGKELDDLIMTGSI